MIHDILLSILNTNGKKNTFPEFILEESNNFLHPAEKKVLKDIIEIANQYRQVQIFIADYSSIVQYRSDREYMLKKNFAEWEQRDDIRDELKGLYIKAFCDGVDNTLNEFRGEILDLEVRYLKKPNFSLLFIYNRILKYQTLLNFHIQLIHGIKTQRLHGCSILHFLQKSSLQGTDELTQAVKTIQNYVYRIFIDQLSQWTIYGKFSDPNQEFFIQNVAPQSSSHKSTHSQNSEKVSSHLTDKSPAAPFSDSASINHEMWHYEICFDMLPHYFLPSWAEKVLFIGQTILMFNSPPPRDESKQSDVTSNDDKIRTSSLFGGDEIIYFQKFDALFQNDHVTSAKIEQIVDEIKICVTKHLSDIAINEADLIEQLKLIKNLFLLGRGELYHEFIKNTKSISIDSENLVRDVNQAFRTASTSVNMNDDVEQFHFSVNRDGMDSFVVSGMHNLVNILVLKYKVQWPLHLIFSPKVIDRYNEMFRFLLRIKKAQYDLQNVWNFHRQFKTEKNSKIWQLRNKLMFLIDNLQYYLQVDVLESQFSILLNSIKNSKDFEHIQHSHTLFQANILSLCFLFNSHADQSTTKSAFFINFSENPIFNILNKILDLVNKYCTLNQESFEGETDNIQETAKKLDDLFTNLVNCLLKLFIGLKAGPSNAPLSQLLLRLDFNYWFSSQVLANENLKNGEVESSEIH